MPIVVQRVLALIGCVALSWAVGQVYPQFFASEFVRALSVVFLGVWGFIFAIFHKLQDLAATPGLLSRERERLVDTLPSIRSRVWFIGAVNTACLMLLIVLTFDAGHVAAWWFPLAVGALVGISMSYFTLVPAWHAEIQAFVDRARLNEAKRKARDDELAALSKFPQSQ